MSKTKDEAPVSGATLTDAPAAQSTPNPASGARKSTGRVWMGTAVGIGSAAIVAALLYTGRNKR
ncbi:hypothetical protein WG907_04145 [Sphingobium sp. AN558]|uniref:hypothetical protein n=1 Tax=Sphingobium sp. AN558 TaxID=3133442 RepID=UPI0030BE904C